jgi:hypothetical protein
LGIAATLKKHLYLVVFLLFTAVGYSRFCRQIDVGYFNDDATYINLSRSLLATGRLEERTLPGHLLVSDRLPGYPLFLTLFTPWIDGHWSDLQFTSVALTIGTLYLFWIFLGALEIAPAVKASTLGLLIVHPTFAVYSVSIMSEPLFLFLMTAAWVGLFDILSNRRTVLAKILPIVLGAGVITRPEGALLLAAILPILIYRKHHASMIQCLGACLITGGWTVWRNLKETQTVSGYAQQWQQVSILGNGQMIHNAIHVIRVSLFDFFLHMGGPNFRIGSLLIGAAVVALIGIGIIILWKDVSGPRRDLFMSWELFMGFIYTVHLFFPAVGTRYFLVLLPFLLLFFLVGAEALSSLGFFLSGLGLLMCYLASNTGASDQLWTARRITPDTYTWIRDHTSPNAFILSARNQTLTLYTDRYSAPSVFPTDLENFRFALLSQGVTHLLLAPTRLLALPHPEFVRMQTLWERPDLWMSAWPAAFEQIYQNVAEQTRLIIVRPAPSYVEAYRHYLAALIDFQRGEEAPGLAEVQAALKSDKTFASAHNLYGTILFYGEHNLVAAAEEFSLSMENHPATRWSLIGLALTRSAQGRLSEAQAFWERSCKISAMPIFWSDNSDLVQKMEKDLLAKAPIHHGPDTGR